jgi:hypothetical protein
VRNDEETVKVAGYVADLGAGGTIGGTEVHSATVLDDFFIDSP